jgi:N utilization substance protein A
VPLAEIEGFSPELLGILNSAGYQTLADVLDLEREDVEKIPGISPEQASQFLTFLAELTTEDGGDEAPAAG